MSRFAHLIIEHPAWTYRFTAMTRRSLRAVFNHERIWLVELSVLCSTDAHVHMLNYNFRGIDSATNVLSFYSGEATYLGDIALSLDTVLREATAQGKTPEHHLAHLVVHAVLHLLGHDHKDDAEAGEMEAKEIAILRRLGIKNPYL